VTFLQRFGGALQLNLHYHLIVIEGVFLDRTDQGLKPRFLKGEPPSDANMAHVVQKISRRVIRKLCHLGYPEAGMDVPVATGYDPLRDTDPELAHTMAASVKQRIAFGERAGQKVRRIGSGFGYEGERPELTGPRCASVNGFCLHANTAIAAHRRDQLEGLMRYTARGAVSLERLAEDANGDLIYTFNRPWSDGTTGIKLSPLELLEKLAALVPLPRVHLVPATWRRIASFATRLFPHRASRVSMARKRRREPRIGTGPGCWAASLLWIWRPVFRHGVGGGSFATFRSADVAHCASLPPSPRSRSSRASCVTSSSHPSHLPLSPPVAAKRYSRSTKPTSA